MVQALHVIMSLNVLYNKDLSWRDVQHIVVRTARPDLVKIGYTDWNRNKAGLQANDYVGFGLMDATKMVDAAVNWTNVPRKVNCTIPRHGVHRTIEANKILEVQIDLSNWSVYCGEKINYLEHVEVSVNLTYSIRGELLIKLISPQKTVSKLTHYRKSDASFGAKDLNWVLMTLHHWGENAMGPWKLTLGSSHSNHDNRGILFDWTLILHGTTLNPLKNNTHVPTSGNSRPSEKTGYIVQMTARIWPSEKVSGLYIKLFGLNGTTDVHELTFSGNAQTRFYIWDSPVGNLIKVELRLGKKKNQWYFIEEVAVQQKGDSRWTFFDFPRNIYEGNPVIRVLARCNDPGVPDNGAKFGDDYRNGRRVKFRCNPPFALVGRHVIVCENGKWSDFTPTCSPPQKTTSPPTTTSSPTTKTTTTTPPTTSSPPTGALCPSGWTWFNSHCYHASSTSTTWDHAKARCEEQEGELVKITSAKENEFVLALAGKFAPTVGKFWIGLKWNSKEYNFFWSDQSLPTYTNWGQGEPNGHGREPCGIMWILGNHAGKWNDRKCLELVTHPAGSVCKRTVLSATANPDSTPQTTTSLPTTTSSPTTKITTTTKTPPTTSSPPTAPQKTTSPPTTTSSPTTKSTTTTTTTRTPPTTSLPSTASLTTTSTDSPPTTPPTTSSQPPDCGKSLVMSHSWCQTPEQRYLQIDLDKTRRYRLTAVVTHSETYSGKWMKRYNITFLAGATFVTYNESGSQKTIEGNQNASSVATYHFKEPFVTKTVRIHPDDTSSACLRTEIYGCDPTPDCILVGSLVWGLWTQKNDSNNYYRAYITRIEDNHIEFILEYNNALSRRYNRTAPVLIIDKIPDKVSVHERVIAVHKSDKPGWYRTGTVKSNDTATNRKSQALVKFDNGDEEWAELNQIRSAKRPRVCIDNI